MGFLQPNGCHRTDGGGQKDAETARGQRMVQAGAADGRRNQLRVPEHRARDIREYETSISPRTRIRGPRRNARCVPRASYRKPRVETDRLGRSGVVFLPLLSYTACDWVRSRAERVYKTSADTSYRYAYTNVGIVGRRLLSRGFSDRDRRLGRGARRGWPTRAATNEFLRTTVRGTECTVNLLVFRPETTGG